MANLVKSFINHNGLDLKSSDIVRDPQYASGMRNIQYKKNGNIGKREGARVTATNSASCGLFDYRRINTSSQQIEDLLVSVSDTVKVLRSTDVSFSYSGTELSVVIEIFYDTENNTHKIQIIEDVNIILDQDLGMGFDEVTTISLADLKVIVDALPGYTMTITGDDSKQAALMEFVRNLNLAEGDALTSVSHWEEVNTSLPSLFPGNTTFKADENFQNSSFVQLNNVLYISNGYDDVVKYDGRNAYRAGLPTGIRPTSVISGAGALSTTNGYRYSIVYVQVDASGNEVSSNTSPDSADLNPTSESIDVTVTNIPAGDGFNTSAGVVNGTQAGVNTILMDNGGIGAHTFKVGDTAYFFDNVAGEYVTREVTAITANDVTIAGAPVDVNDNQVVSNNLRIQIFRNQDGGTFKFLVEEVPNNPFVATQTITDNVLDNDLGIQFITPISPHDPPPKGRYISSYNNQMFISGNLEFPNTVAWSAPESPEYWAPSIFSITTQSPNGDRVTGLSQSNEVMAVFEDRAIHIISGDIANNNIRVDTITKDIGCVSHHTIQEVRGSLYFLSDRGVYSTVSGQLPTQVSFLIEPNFDREPIIPDEQKKVLRRSLAVNFRDKEQYILYIPAEDTRGATAFANQFSTIYVEDYYRGAWLEWSDLNMAGGAVIHNDKLVFVERALSDFTGLVRYNLHSQMNRGDNWDFNDNDEPVKADYRTAWYNFNNPSIFKKFLRFKVFATEETNNNSFMIDVDIERDFIADNVIGNFLIDFSEGQGGYGIVEYGVASYGDVFQSNQKYKIGPIKAKSLRFVMKNESPQENIDITGWEIEVANPYRQELKE